MTRNAVGVASVVQVALQPSPLVVLPSSQASEPDTQPSPHTALQSASLHWVAPEGQQPSPSIGVVMAGWVQLARQVPAFTSESAVQTMPSSQLVGHEPVPLVIAVSQVSGEVTTPSPQAAAQSESVPIVAPEGQQPSPSAGEVIAEWVQDAAQVPAPESVSAVQAMPSSHAVGQLPAPEVMPVSQVSPDSTTPLPQTAVQSESVAMVAPGGQQPSPPTGAVMAVVVHVALQVPPPISMSVVQTLPSSHAVGQAPLIPAAIAVSHASPVETTPSPQAAEQSGSVASVAPGGQHMSPAAVIVTGAWSQVASQVPSIEMLSVVQ